MAIFPRCEVQQPLLPEPPTTLSNTSLPTFEDVTRTNTTPGVTDRAELIERIKAGQTPTWIPNRNLSDRYYPNHTPTSAPRLTDEHPDRPQSALHQGIFANESGRNLHLAPGSPPPTAAFPQGKHGFHELMPAPLQTTFPRPLEPQTSPPRHTVSSGFVLKTPTSPLVHSSNPDTDGSSDDSARPIDIEFSERHTRRKSLPPSAPSTLQFSPTAAPSSFARGHTFSTAGSPNRQWGESPSPTSRQLRRLSGIGGTSSELPFGSFVGSYEESILNGRMSTTPSRPLNFLAQIGVLGIGKCKQSLRCPTHVTLPFPAYFYSVGDYDSPSPYVGQIDLDAALGSQSSKGKKPPPGVGGSYRIPQRGQLQIVIKNPNKTAVKLFLVPYDLRDMEPGTKTFIRQKSYSVGGELLDVPMLNRQKEKDSLRYLIHLHIVCPSRGRYYLFRSLRVVFANRVPDGKERLRNETLWPEPKYSAWKPEASAVAPTATTTATPGNGRQRSSSLYGAATAIPQGLMPPPPPLPQPPPPPPIEMDVDRNDSTYEKLDLSSSLKKVKGRGLLARRLKQLEVEAAVLDD
ncbi:hypothetical protein FN846DRAFT_897998 [Sphaerosporella brunnea]|uniref:Atos-like conserved domain-containing protein n=1 Tax=Sphaerosporella brunnea TaxID=1250544 RepID=A0A5J5F362_9PEZI|nr:hypothetical protein FN846DRAFT_897998 [Sphaerosporella brunnea]